MSDWRVPLADVALADADIEAVAETYRSGWLSTGPRTASLEEDFAAYVGSAHAVALSSCTAALHLGCLATGLAPGDEVIVPSLTFVATVNAIRYAGATPVFADVRSLEEPWLSADEVEKLIGPRTRAVMSMPYGGHPGEVVRLLELADAHDLMLLEDAAHALGARAEDRSLGTFGRFGAFSFFSNKNLPVGEGGMLVTDDEEVAKRVRLLRSHGMTSLSWDRHKGHAFGYDVVETGFNYRLDEPRATLASALLAKLDDANARRASLDAEYRRRLADVAEVTPVLPPRPGAESAHHLFAVVVSEGVDRDAVRRHMHEQGVQTSLHYPPVHLFSTYAQPSLSLPVTERYAERAITLPLFPHMTEEQLGIVVEVLSTAVLHRGD
jgi:dTDP-4-amino-4,6-dideoxygalactose transaminase